MKTNVPAQKVVAASAGVALVQIAIWFIGLYQPTLDIPEGIQIAILTLVTFFLGYYVPPHPRDGVL